MPNVLIYTDKVLGHNWTGMFASSLFVQQRNLANKTNSKVRNLPAYGSQIRTNNGQEVSLPITVIKTLPMSWAWSIFVLIFFGFLDSRLLDSQSSRFADFQILGFPDSFQMSRWVAGRGRKMAFRETVMLLSAPWAVHGAFTKRQHRSPTYVVCVLIHSMNLQVV